jgi:hypothetical protein
MGRGMDLGRAESIDTLVRRREAVEQRLSFSLHQAEVVDTALADLDRGLADRAQLECADETLRASARALLTVALGEVDYDVTLTPARAAVAVRIRHTLFGLQVDVVERASAGVPPATEHSADPGPGRQESGGQG